MNKRCATLRWACTAATALLAALTALSYSHGRSISYKESRLALARGWLGVERDRTSYWRDMTVKALRGRPDPAALLDGGFDAVVDAEWVTTDAATAVLPWRCADAGHFSVSLPLPALLFAFAVPTVLSWRSHRERCRTRDPCARCGYSLTGLSAGSPCPECGKRGESPA